MRYRLGIDIGSKTAKLVILDGNNAIVASQYSLHRSNVRKTLSDLLANTIWRFGDRNVGVCVTGSAGMRFAQDLGLPYVQEVIASRKALQTFIPEADVAIELGGEDAKILFLRDGVEERMNGSCAGGTGGFIDVMCGMLSVNAKQFNSLAAGYTHIYPIASRCAVFAQTDVRPLLNAGVRKSDIAASVLQAVVTQTVSGLACGRPIGGTVAFLGGPAEVYSELVYRFRLTLELRSDQVIKPKDAHLFVASGAALLAVSELTVAELKRRIDVLPQEQGGEIGRLPMLFSDQTEYTVFKERHAVNKVPRVRLMGYEGDIFIGIDAGSTTLKLAAITERGELLYSAYENNKGNPVEIAREVLGDFYRSIPREYDGTPLASVRHGFVCGYGEDLLKAAFRLDGGEVETVAHLRAAQEFCPDASFVLDIGGQDIKCMRLKDGLIDTVTLNEACSSGCGALIQGFARSFGHTLWSYTDEALVADSPVDLGTRCTVFMTSRVRHAQKEGVSTADISAGLAYSVVRNALHKVLGINTLAHLGKKIVVQGGTFMNDAVLRVFERESGLEVIRPDIANLMGAYGAAFLARDEYIKGGKTDRSGMLNVYALEAMRQDQRALRCEACSNACSLTVNSFTFSPTEKTFSRRYEKTSGSAASARSKLIQEGIEPSLFISGNRCERGRVWAQSHLAGYVGHGGGNTRGGKKRDRPPLCPPSTKPRIGIPPVLNLYEQYPFWRTLFSELGFEVLKPQSSSGVLYRAGAKQVLSESVCYPAKLMHGHIDRLLADGAKYIFMPTYRRCEGQGCAVLAGYGSSASYDVQAFCRGRKDDTAPTDEPGLITLELETVLPSACEVEAIVSQTALIVVDDMVANAHRVALEALHIEVEKRRHRVRRMLDRLEDDDATGVVLLGHPYHGDPGINHSIDRMLVELGYPVFGATDLDHIPYTPSDSCADLPAAEWSQVERLYRIARYVAGHPRLHLVHLLSFGCGVDAMITSTISEIIRDVGKPYTAIKLDEMTDPATLRIRLRSLDYALRSGRDRASMPIALKSHTDSLVDTTDAFDDEGRSVRTEIVTSVKPEDVERGLALLNNDLCYPMLAWGGRILGLAERSPAPLKISLPNLCSNCRSVELQRVLNRVLPERKWVTIGKEAPDNPPIPPEPCSQHEGGGPRIGILGNAAMLFTPEFNDSLLKRVVAEGATPVIPDRQVLSASERPLADLLPALYEEGIRDFIYVQSFGCLHGHVDARGIRPRLRSDYPTCNITFLEYDPGISQINQLNRLKLAVAIAHERRSI